MIYFIQNKSGYGGRTSDKGLIKIGTTVRLSVRLPQIANGIGCDPEQLEVLAVMDGGYAEESAFHKKFAGWRVMGEWFEVSYLLLQTIATEGRKWTSADDMPSGRSIYMDDDLCDKARKLAALRAISMAEMFADVLRPWVDQEWSKEVKRLVEEEKAKGSL